MKRYPFEFHQADALEYLAEHGHEFDAIHASPPCQEFSAMRRGRWQDRSHPDLIEPTRRLLIDAERPYVIENVVGAPLRSPVLLCGSMFGLCVGAGTLFAPPSHKVTSQLRRHRLFEMPWFDGPAPKCDHGEYAAIGVYGGGQHPQRRYGERHRTVRVPTTIGVWGNGGGSSSRDGLIHYGVHARREAMGIDWMTGAELSQAIPPAYTEWIGRHLMDRLTESA